MSFSSIALLYKAATYRPDVLGNDLKHISMPNAPMQRTVAILPSHYQAYQTLTRWKPGLASVIHPLYVQVLSLPMQLAMMSQAPFPFKVMGLVHLANHIDVTFLPDQSATLQLQTHFSDVKYHRKGWVFGIKTQAYVNGQLAIEARSDYLARVVHSDETHKQWCTQEHKQEHASALPMCAPTVLPIAFSRSIGREYARVSGDYNPIHLSQYTAKLLGFKKAIAHGMFSKALCLSTVFTQSAVCKEHLLSAMHISTEFKQPIYLPKDCQLDIQERPSEDSLSFDLCSKSERKNKLHMQTSMRFA